MMNYSDDMEVIKDKEYMRIQGEELEFYKIVGSHDNEK